MKKIEKKTKIVATIGPSSVQPAILKQMIENGVNVFRLNFSHGDHDFHQKAIELIQKQAKNSGVHIGILADLQGPKIRTGKTEGDRPIILTKGTKVVVTPKKQLCTDKIISIDYPKLAQEISINQIIVINDGAIRLQVLEIDTQGNISCLVANTGVYASRKGVNLPNVQLSLPSITPKDTKDLKFILEQPIQYIALSFVRNEQDLIKLKKIVHAVRSDIKLIAKIEKPEAAHAIEPILNHCDGIMVARGDLGVETSPWEVPILQKHLIKTANEKGKLVIVATQMLESMISNPLPTRAESTDVANAILDGTDAIMLSGETSIGTYPVESVNTMSLIAETTENSNLILKKVVDLSICKSASHAVCEAAAWASRDLGDVPIIVFTMSGDTALYLSKIRPQAKVFAFTPLEQTARLLSLAWNIQAVCIPMQKDFSKLQEIAINHLKSTINLKKCSMVVIINGKIALSGTTDSMTVIQI